MYNEKTRIIGKPRVRFPYPKRILMRDIIILQEKTVWD